MLDISMGREITINQTSSELTFRDILGSWKVRWGIDRMNYKVEPGFIELETLINLLPFLFQQIIK